MTHELARPTNPGHVSAEFAVPDVTVPDFVFGRAWERGDRRAMVDAATGRALTYRELTIAVWEVAAGLAARGVRAGDVVALCAPNSIEFAVSWLAALSAGAIVTTVNPDSTAGEITQQLRQVSARWLVTTLDLFEQKLADCARASGVIETVLIGEGDPIVGASAFESLRMEVKEEYWPSTAHPSDVAFLPCSSGTTGLPKAVVLSHRNLVASLCQMRLGQAVGEDDVTVAVLPLFHLFGLQMLNLALVQGATVVLMPRFELKGFLRAVQDYHVTRVAVVPPMIQALADSDLVDDYDLSSLRVLMAGAAPLAPGVAVRCATRIGCRVKQAYGMTELGGGTHIAPDDGPDRPDCIGPALPGVECRVVDCETGAEVPLGAAGELLIRSSGTMRGYLDNPEATAATIDPDGWLRTGDIVSVDADGWYRITDRIKELIKYKGFQVAPAELEGILLEHPAVADAAVVRSPDAVAGEVPKAFIVLRGSASAEELIAWAGERVAPYKRVRRVEFVEEIPKSPSGKILRRVLIEREQSAQEMAA
jgi:acyl-CoA synthetase (AMP-forming)/AMP-acid ligase II